MFTRIDFTVCMGPAKSVFSRLWRMTLMRTYYMPLIGYNPKLVRQIGLSWQLKTV